MKQVVETGLPAVGAPIEWAVSADKILYTAHIPIRPDGSFETGDATRQMEVTMGNLKRTVEAAGGTMADVTQVLIYVTRAEDFAAINEVYARYFDPPYPNRATVVVAGIMVPGVVVEIVAHAHLP
jgi:2-iminobutanoate/2-iminopropanoate deaminase